MRSLPKDTFRSRVICLIVLPLTKCSRRIRPVVSTVSIPLRSLRIESEQRISPIFRGSFGRRYPLLRGQNCTPNNTSNSMSKQKAAIDGCWPCDSVKCCLLTAGGWRVASKTYHRPLQLQKRQVESMKTIWLIRTFTLTKAWVSDATSIWRNSSSRRAPSDLGDCRSVRICR
jgi:hypothetical protein